LPVIAQASVLEDMDDDPDVVEVSLTAEVTRHEYVAGKTTEVWAYNGMVPGPTLQARVGNRLIVHFTNALPDPTTIHWHGLRITPEMDGDPHHTDPILAGETFTYDFVVPDAGSFWFHPHYNSPEQIERGLMGTLIVHEMEPPQFDAERILFTDDVRLKSNGELSPFSTAGMDVMHGRAGNVLLLNGQDLRAPIAVQSWSRERWRLFNGSNARTMELSVTGAYFTVIGTDGGLLSEPYLTDRLTLAIGQRYDLDVWFDGEPGATAELMSHVLSVDENDNVVELPISLQTFVYDPTLPMKELTEVTIPFAAPSVLPADSTPEKSIVLDGFNDNGVIRFTLNDYAFPNEEHWEAPLGDMKVEIRNELHMEHPFHLHGQFFEILGGHHPPGLKDTVLVGGGESVVLLVHFTNPGTWMYHCHVPEHAEAGMMGHVTVHSGHH
jgi:FtsP/CotA-like multicopper oxidase with cupredoxin domain